MLDKWQNYLVKLKKWHEDIRKCLTSSTIFWEVGVGLAALWVS
jgi:hypothetical protein